MPAHPVPRPLFGEGLCLRQNKCRYSNRILLITVATCNKLRALGLIRILHFERLGGPGAPESRFPTLALMKSGKYPECRYDTCH